MIYFISNATTGAVKIGYSKNPSKRLNSLQTATPDRLSLLGTIHGGLEHEAAFHDRFAQHRLQGGSRGEVRAPALSVRTSGLTKRHEHEPPLGHLAKPILTYGAHAGDNFSSTRTSDARLVS
jgi:hypothetical protein